MLPCWVLSISQEILGYLFGPYMSQLITIFLALNLFRNLLIMLWHATSWSMAMPMIWATI
jgi:hypothetical protein